MKFACAGTWLPSFGIGGAVVPGAWAGPATVVGASRCLRRGRPAIDAAICDVVSAQK
jgi:hypothetical protein